MPSTAPPFQLLANAVILQGPALRDVHYLVSLGVRDASRRNGIRPSPRLLALVDALSAAAARESVMSLAGHGDVPDGTDVTTSDPLDQITTREAAMILGVSPRQVRRLADKLGANRGTVFTFDRAAVEAMAHERKDKVA